MNSENKIAQIARLALGLILFVFGLNKFLNFMPMPAMPEGAQAFMGGLASAPYFFPLLAVTEIFGGALLLLKKYVALSLLILAPVVLNMVLFHLFLAPLSGLFAYLVLALYLVVVWSRLEAFKGVLQVNT